MTDFSALISQPRLILIGAAAQMASEPIACAQHGFHPQRSRSHRIIGERTYYGNLPQRQACSELLGAIAVSAYSIWLLCLDSKAHNAADDHQKERLIRMAKPRIVSARKIIFPIVGLLCTAFIVPSGRSISMLFFGNLLKESTVTRRLAEMHAVP